jgi:predicted tellurium resistance membrane protein TerC
LGQYLPAMLDLLTSPQAWISLATLALMEVVLGVDNIVFLTILSGRLPKEQQPRARRLGLVVALATRLGLLFAITWVMGLTRELFSVLGHGVSGRDLILLAGGLFLVGKATVEIHDKLEVQHEAEAKPVSAGAFWAVVAQIGLLDIVFSLDSVITAVGMSKDLPVMVAAMLVAMGVMMIFAGRIGDFIERHPTMKILALSFLILIGVMLVMEALGHHVEKGYIYFAMAFSLGVELLNMRMRKAAPAPVTLHHRFEKDEAAPIPSPPPGEAG